MILQCFTRHHCGRLESHRLDSEQISTRFPRSSCERDEQPAGVIVHMESAIHGAWTHARRSVYSLRFGHLSYRIFLEIFVCRYVFIFNLSVCILRYSFISSETLTDKVCWTKGIFQTPHTIGEFASNVWCILKININARITFFLFKLHRKALDKRCLAPV